MCKSLSNPIPVQIWTLDGQWYVGEGKIMGTSESYHALLDGRMITPLTWGADFDPEARACLEEWGAKLVTVADDNVIVTDGCPLFASQVSWKEA